MLILYANMYFNLTLVFQAKLPFFEEKISQIAENKVHNIEPWYFTKTMIGFWLATYWANAKRTVICF
jgi:hypothetical protein